MGPPFAPWRTGRFFIIAGFSWVGLAAQETGRDEPIQLPTYTVTAERELPPPEKWHYARVLGFEVLSSDSARATNDLLLNFQRFTHAISLVWPGMEPPPGAPAALILCGRADQFDPFLPPAGPGSVRTRTSLSVRSHEQAAIMIDLQTKGISLATMEGATIPPGPVAPGDAVLGTDPTTEFTVDAYRQLYREYVRFLLAARASPVLPWFAEGLAQLFMAMEVTGTSITLGKLEDPNTVVANPEDRDFNAALAKQALLPLPELFAVQADSSLALNPLGRTWAKQCYAFVHWGLYGDEGIHQKDFFNFLARLEREPLSEPLFKACFKQSYQDMLQTLRTYIEFTRHKVAGVRAGKGEKIPDPPPVVLRDATEAEIGRLKGEALLLAGRKNAAHTALITPYMRGERDPALLAALGLEELGPGDSGKARKLLEAAVSTHLARPRAYVELARLRLNDNLAQPQGGGGKLSAAQTAQVLEPLFAAREMPPSRPDLYELMAEAWMRSSVPPTASNLAVIEQGVKQFPRNAGLVYRAAELRARHGFTTEAHGLVRLGLRVAPDDATRSRFEQLQTRLPPLPAVPPN